MCRLESSMEGHLPAGYQACRCYNSQGVECGQCYQILRRKPTWRGSGEARSVPQCKAHGFMAEKGMRDLVDALQEGGYGGRLMLQYPIPGLGCNNASRLSKARVAWVCKMASREVLGLGGQQGGAGRGRRRGSGPKCRKGSDLDRKEVGKANLSRTTDKGGRFGKGLTNKVDLVLTKHDGTLLCVEVQGSSHARAAALHRDKHKEKAIQEAGMDYAEVVIAEVVQWEEEAGRLLSLL